MNPYMPIDEEATIGIFRPDGTAKPELDPMIELGAFFRTAAPLLDDFDPDPVVLVVPHARAFLGRTNGIDASKITVRALAERIGQVWSQVRPISRRGSGGLRLVGGSRARVGAGGVRCGGEIA